MKVVLSGSLRTSLSISLLVGVFLLAPALIIVIGSFSGGSSLVFPPTEPGVDAYLSIFSSENYRKGIFNSVIVGATSVVVGLPIALSAAYGLNSLRPSLKVVVTGLLLLGIIAPLVVSGVAFLLIFQEINFYGRLGAVALAVMTVNLPFAVLLIRGSIEALDSNQSEAATTLGATPRDVFFRIEIPQIRPALIASALLLFVLGISEFLVSMIISTARSATLPVEIFSSLRSGVTPTMAAVAGIYVLVTIIIVASLGRVGVLKHFYEPSK